MGKEPMRLVFMKNVNGVDKLILAVTATGNQGSFVKILAGVGTAYWIWPAIPSGKVIACDFTDAPIVDADIAVNNANIAAITTTPEEVLTYDTP